MLHPINYSMIMNLVIICFSGALAIWLREPLALITGILLTQHALGRFNDEDENGGEDEDDRDPNIGFTAQV